MRHTHFRRTHDPDRHFRSLARTNVPFSECQRVMAALDAEMGPSQSSSLSTGIKTQVGQSSCVAPVQCKTCKTWEVICRHHFPFLAMAAKVGSDHVKFLFKDVWKSLTNKEGWSYKKGSAIDTDWWVLPHAKSKRKVELVQRWIM